jgi:hypothetical protein
MFSIITDRSFLPDAAVWFKIIASGKGNCQTTMEVGSMERSVPLPILTSWRASPIRPHRRYRCLEDQL